MDLGIEGKTALVAASSRGLGRACAQALAAEGANVVVTSRDAQALASTAAEISAATGSEVVPIAADLRDSERIDSLFEKAVDRLGPVDILVTNTGPPRAGRFEDLSDEDWIDAFSLVAIPMVRLIRHALPGMRERGWGRVVSIQSTSVKQPIPHLGLSNGVRPGAQGILKPLAEAVASDGVTINTVLPGMFLTDRLVNDLRQSAEREGITVEDAIERAGSRNPIGRVGEPQELGSLVAYLASEPAAYLTGACIQVDGGSVRSLA